MTKYWEGKKRSEDTKRKISKAHMRMKKPWVTNVSKVGIKFSEEHKEKLSIAHLGKKHSEETKLKLRLISLGIKQSEETKKKNSLWHIQNPNRKFKKTAIELKIKSLLDSLKINYFSQHPLGNITIVDFYIPEKNLVIECDGCYWHGCPVHFPDKYQERHIIDNEKTKKLETLGYKIIRFWEHEIKNMSILNI